MAVELESMESEQKILVDSLEVAAQGVKMAVSRSLEIIASSDGWNKAKHSESVIAIAQMILDQAAIIDEMLEDSDPPLEKWLGNG